MWFLSSAYIPLLRSGIISICEAINILLLRSKSHETPKAIFCAKPISLVSQRHQRVYFSCAPRRDVAG